MTTTWQIAQLKRNPSNGLVIEVAYIMNFLHEEEADRKVGVVTLTGNPTDPAFIAYEDLTEEIVINWVKEELGTEAVDEIEAQFLAKLEAKIEKKNNPTFLVGTPW